VWFVQKERISEVWPRDFGIALGVGAYLADSAVSESEIINWKTRSRSIKYHEKSITALMISRVWIMLS